ncbi:hypothetical protein [Bifidobacterium tibiigranuli]|jgi:hypothetical protein|uniref:hypothetical protein n=1 Tax=Bifidobacterium tibiigranuli TaxID=2172043 RepID=UPI0026EE4B13|nr:hypothetical protein [Bifidobacterium tibiigranuli]MCI2186343.1 hypothetical protein [Bifidobacterium tibiigranuli]MCI2203831.1 hypothetical protein [Bifidobacterium tibiigranuli]
MSDGDFKFKLDCAQDAVTPKALNQAVSAFTKMLAEADASDWRISRLELHSIELAAKPVVVDEAVQRSFDALDTFARLAARLAARGDVRREEVSRFSGSFSALSDLAKETGADIIVSSQKAEGTFTPAVLTNINRLLIRSARRSFGHVRGIVDKVILQPTHRTLGLVDRITQSRVDVRFGPSLDSVVKRIQIGMEVDAKGFVRADDGELLSVEAQELEIVNAERRPLTTAEDLEGLIGLDFTGGLNSVDFISALRDSHDSNGATAGGRR